MKVLKDESGQAMIITILAMTCLIGFAALATDIGLMFHEKRLAQTAADAAAIAGASAINYGSVSNAATAAATSNGFTAGTNTLVTISNPPADGPHAGVAGYVEAVITQTQPTVLLNFFALHSMQVTARAVAWNGGASLGCIYVLDPSASPAMDLQGSFDVSAPTCGVEIASNSSSALEFTGGGGSLTAGSIGVVGGASGQTGDSTPAPVTGIAPFSDPISYPAPTVTTGTTPTAKDSAGNTATCTTPTGNITGTLTAPTNGLVCYSGNVTLSNVTFANATYVFTGNVTFGGNIDTISNASVSGPNGATIDINSGALSINTGTVLNLSAPGPGSSLPYSGVVLMQPLANTNEITIQKGNATGSLTGIIWAPGAELFLNDSGGDKSGGLTLTTDLIVDTLEDKTATLTMNSYSLTVGTSPLTRVVLVE